MKTIPSVCVSYVHIIILDDEKTHIIMNLLHDTCDDHLLWLTKKAIRITIITNNYDSNCNNDDDDDVDDHNDNDDDEKSIVKNGDDDNDDDNNDNDYNYDGGGGLNTWTALIV